MVGRALSERVKRMAGCRALNAKYQAAMDAYRREANQPLEKGRKRRGLRPIAAEYGVSHSTLQDLLKGGRSMSAFHQSRQKLSHAEERVLVNLILECADRGCPLNMDRIRACANEILAKRNPAKAAEPVGQNWVGRFLDRYRDEIQTHWSRPLDTQRARSLNPEAVKAWFDLVEDLVVKRGIKPHNIYGMDETGCPPSNQGVERVVGRRGTKVQHKSGSANRENVTAIVTICGDGSALRPTIIFKARNFLRKWGENNVAKASLAVSENGWTDGGLALDWIKKDFDPQTREKAAGETRALFLDGHSSHFSAALLEYAKANNIEIFGYPPHCTHALQGLDVACFARMKECFKARINAFEEEHRQGVGKEDFCEVFGHAYLEAFTQETILAAFEKTGIHPFNRDVISPEQMKPSEQTSTNVSFPQPQTSPVRAVMAWMRDYSALEDTDRDEAAGDGMPIDPRLQTPTRRRLHPASDPGLATPSKRMRLLRDGLKNTSSGSMLVSRAVATYQQISAVNHSPVHEYPPPLSSPNWSLLHSSDFEPLTPHPSSRRDDELVESLQRAKEHIDARDLIIEGQRAQLIVQGLELKKLAQSLNAKEKRKKSDRSILFPGGKGRHLTDEEVINLKRQQEEEQREGEAEKQRKRDRRAERRSEKQEIEARWLIMKAEHAEKVKEWEVECEALRAQKVPQSRWPKKPTRPRKPQPAPLDPSSEEDDDDEEEDEV